MWELSLNHKDFPSQNPPTEDGCVQCGLDCPFKCWAAFIVRWRQPDGKTALLYTMFPTASNEHNLSLESTAVLESKSTNRFRNQTRPSFKSMKLCLSLSLFFLAHSVIIAWRNGWMRDITVISKIKSACCLVWLLCLLPPSYTQSDLPDPVRQVSVAGVLLKTPPPPVATCLLWHKMSVFWHPESKLTIFILSNLMHLNNPKPTDIVNECNMYIYSALYFLDMQLSV